MKHPDLKKYANEMNALQDLPPATVELPPLAAIERGWQLSSGENFPPETFPPEGFES